MFMMRLQPSLPDDVLRRHFCVLSAMPMTVFGHGCSGDYDKSIALVSSGSVDVARLVTHRYVFADAVKAFDAVTAGRGEDGKACIKVQICQGPAQS